MNHLKVEYLSDENEDEWNKFVDNHPESTFYHTLKWKDLLEKSFDFEAKYMLIRTQEGELVGICPFFITKNLRFFRIINSIPKSDCGGPLILDEHTNNVSDTIIENLKNMDGLVYAQVRFSDNNISKYFQQDNSSVDTRHGTMVLDLKEKPVDFIWNKIFTNKKGQRKFIRRFDGENFQITESQNKEDIEKFYGLYYNNINYIGGSPYPLKFFENVWALLYPEHFNILFAENHEKCIGSLAFFINKKKSTIYLTYLGLDRDVSNTYHTSYYLYWESIKWAQNQGVRYVNFGSTPSDIASEYYSIKTDFGATFNQNYILIIPFNKKLFLLRENLLNSWAKTKNKLPKSLAKKFGNNVYRILHKI